MRRRHAGEDIKGSGARHAELAHDDSARGCHERVPVPVEDRVAEEADRGFYCHVLAFAIYFCSSWATYRSSSW